MSMHIMLCDSSAQMAPKNITFLTTPLTHRQIRVSPRNQRVQMGLEQTSRNNVSTI